MPRLYCTVYHFITASVCFFSPVFFQLFNVFLFMLLEGNKEGMLYFRFLLEGSEGTVLYTGDFRLSRQDFIDFEHLKSGTKSVLRANWVILLL